MIDSGLREEFGFEHILWVFSGRRGIHCWVCDARARALQDTVRGAIAAFFAVYRGQERQEVPKLSLSPTLWSAPYESRVYDILLENWTQVRCAPTCECSRASCRQHRWCVKEC